MPKSENQSGQPDRQRADKKVRRPDVDNLDEIVRKIFGTDPVGFSMRGKGRNNRPGNRR